MHLPLIYCFGDNYYRSWTFLFFLILWIIIIVIKQKKNSWNNCILFRCNLKSSLKKRNPNDYLLPLFYIYVFVYHINNFSKLHNFMLEINFHNKQQYFCCWWCFFFSFLHIQSKKTNIRREVTTIIIISDLQRDFSYVTCSAHPGVTWYMAVPTIKNKIYHITHISSRSCSSRFC